MAFLFLIPVANAEVIINEIMYNPSTLQGNDFDFEWVELYNNGSTKDLSGLYFEGKKLNGTLEGNKYAIISRDKEKFIKLYGNLSCNVIKMIFILDNKVDGVSLSSLNYQQVVNYSSGLGGNGNGKTLERKGNEFYESLVVNGTPCKENSVGFIVNNSEGNLTGNWTNLTGNVNVTNPASNLSNFTNASNLISTSNLTSINNLTNAANLTNVSNQIINVSNQTSNVINLTNTSSLTNLTNLTNTSYSPDVDYSALKITGFMANPVGYDNDIMPGGEWIELYNSGNSVLDLNGLKIKDYGGHILVLGWNNTVPVIANPSSFVVVYRNGDTKFSLVNEGYEEIFLLDKKDGLIDMTSYNGSKEGLAYRKVNGAFVEDVKKEDNTVTGGKKSTSSKSSSKQKTKSSVVTSNTAAKSPGKTSENSLDNEENNAEDSAEMLKGGDNLIYESSDVKAGRLGIYFFALTLVIGVLALLFRKNL